MLPVTPSDNSSWYSTKRLSIAVHAYRWNARQKELALAANIKVLVFNKLPAQGAISPSISYTKYRHFWH